MIEFIKYILEDSWRVIRCLIIMALVGGLIWKAFNRFLRHLNIRKHGWPPSHLDADGDFEQKEENGKTY